MGSGYRTLFLLTVPAAVGGILLVVIIATFWMYPNDNFAYWIAGDRLLRGEPIYAPSQVAFEPYAYHYPPPLAQVLAPLTVVLTPVPYVIVNRALMLLATWELAGRKFLQMLALIAFIPVAIALRIENVELFMAVAVLYGLRGWSWLFTILALLKVSPGLGIVYLLLRRRWRDAAAATVLGAVIVTISVVLAPDLWRQWLDSITGRADMIGNSLIPLPYSIRAVAGFLCTVAGGLMGRRNGELLLVLGMTIANPGLSLQGFAVLAAAVPIWFAGPDGIGLTREPVRLGPSA
jgi:hypothetical protein